jgi:hypothetical protein
MTFDLKARQRERATERARQLQEEADTETKLAMQAQALAKEINEFSDNQSRQPDIGVDKNVVKLNVKGQPHEHALTITVNPNDKYEVFQLGNKLVVPHRKVVDQTKMLDYVLEWFNVKT